MRIAYIGSADGTSLHRARALKRLGHEVHIVDPYLWLGRSKWVSRWIHRMGAIGVGALIDKPMEEKVRAIQPDMIIVNQGEFLGSRVIRRMRNLSGFRVRLR